MSENFDFAGGFAAPLATFTPGVRYFSAMDCAIYLKEDCSYRSARISKKISLLLDPYEDEKVVGVKIKGVQHLIEQLLSILSADVSAGEKVRLAQLLRVAMVSEEEAELALGEAEVERRKQLAERAREFVEQNEIQFEIPLKMAA